MEFASYIDMITEDFYTLLWALPSTHLISTFIGYWLHRILHTRYIKFWSDPHRIDHHGKLYPVHSLRRNTYEPLPGLKGNTIPFLLLSIPIICGVFYIFPLLVSSVIAIYLAIIGYCSSKLHDVFHLNSHPFKKIFPFYQTLEKLHDIHHLRPDKNFGIVFFEWDWVFGTLECSTDRKNSGKILV